MCKKRSKRIAFPADSPTPTSSGSSSFAPSPKNLPNNSASSFSKFPKEKQASDPLSLDKIILYDDLLDD